MSWSWDPGPTANGAGAPATCWAQSISTPGPASSIREKIELPFFRHFLKGDTNYTATEAQVFETGTDQWRRFDAWPPRNVSTQTLYFRPSGNLSFEAPTENGDAFDEYVSDPAKPVPFTSEPSTGYPRSYPVEDQRFAASRPDVLVYETGPLDQDLTFAGPLKADLACLDHGHRFRLGGQAHRCLSRRLS